MKSAALAILLLLPTASIVGGSQAFGQAPPTAAPVYTAPAAAAPDPHAHLQQILERPMYRAWRARQAQEELGDLPNIETAPWMKRVANAIGDSVGNFFRWLFRSSGPRWRPGSSWGFGSALPGMLKAVAWVVLGLALLFAVIVLIRALMRTAPTVGTARVLSREQIRAAMESGDALALGGSQWIDEADRLAAEQNFRAVYRALYLALLSGLHTAGKIEHAPNRTNWTYVQRYRGPSDERSTFSELTALFDRVWYGRHAAVGSDIGALRKQVNHLTQPGVAK